ncbi:MAG: hypothetical protein RLW68_01830 [Devosia marina]|uniref:hypothetical protein n=1 Tax=Devosia marina TaxID=2683198 RepID=UPI0032EFFFEF
MRATWFMLEDGTPVDPAECSTVDGVLTHESGKPVAMRSHDCPMSTGVDIDEAGKVPFGGKGDHDGDGSAGGSKPAQEPKPRDMQAEKPRQGYKTRQTKARR